MVYFISDVLFLDGPQSPEHHVYSERSKLYDRARKEVQEEDVRPEMLVLVVYELGEVGEVLVVAGEGDIEKVHCDADKVVCSETGRQGKRGEIGHYEVERFGF